jgi:hypothetical protein
LSTSAQFSTTEVQAMSFLAFLSHIVSRGRAAAGGARRNPRAPRVGRPDGSARDAGMSTAEYAVGTVAAVAFAGVLYAVISSPATRDVISSVVQRALAIPF